MNRRLIAVLLCIIVAIGLAAYIASNEWNPLHVNNNPLAPKIGIFYYVWYNSTSDDSWNRAKIADQPVLGYYNSSDPQTIESHLLSMKQLGVDFVVISWWGFYDDYGRFTDYAAKQVFQTVEEMTFQGDEENMSKIKLAIMVEPFNIKGSSYNYSEIYNHIYDEFVLPYPSIYLNETKPLLYFFSNGSNDVLTDHGTFPRDALDRFNVVLVGQTDYVQWEYTNVNYWVYPDREPYTNETSVTPRFDDSRYAALVNKTPCIVDVNLTQGEYDNQWKNAIQLWKDGKISTIMITSWNEYVERTAIEPHYDATALNKDPNLLYNETQAYISEIHRLSR